jgi:UDP-N-acetylmuramoylalanine--D-glutamate ligase
MVAVMAASKHFEPADLDPKLADDYVLVVGLGESGLAAARYLSALGEQVLVIDSRRNPPGIEALRNSNPEISVQPETLDSKWLARATRVVLSPGLSVNLPLVAEAAARGLAIDSEIEIFARAATAPVIAITGSNGKSTVTSLVAALLKAQGFDAPAGGNLGPPALELLEHASADAYVIEVSSFQLETTRSLKPRAAALLNISADHIDRHGSLARYAALKGSLLANAETAVVNWDDPLVRELAPRREETIPFSVRQPLSHGWSVVEQANGRWLARDLEPLLASSMLSLAGETGEANALAGLALTMSLGGNLKLAISALPAFRGLPHRLMLVAERQGVRYIDDSKATNVGAAVAALTGSNVPTVLIAGGQSKGADFASLAGVVAGRVRAAVLLGEAAEQLAATLKGHTQTLIVADMPAAVEAAAALAAPGDRVLLSPACASQDMFIDYKDRGNAFAAAVRSLPE